MQTNDELERRIAEHDARVASNGRRRDAGDNVRFLVATSGTGWRCGVLRPGTGVVEYGHCVGREPYDHSTAWGAAYADTLNERAERRLVFRLDSGEVVSSQHCLWSTEERMRAWEAERDKH